MTTLISFIGAAKPRRDGMLATSHYQTATYSFEDGFSATTKFFGHAALKHFQQRENELTPTRWIIIGTKTSGWDMLADVAFDSREDCLDVATKWAERVQDEIAGGAASSKTLQEFSSIFPTTAGIELRLIIVQDDADDIFGCLHENIEPNESVILDITHGFRSMPIHALIALGALRWMKGISIADILYGGLDKPKFDIDKSPAVSLKLSAQLARATPALAAVHINNDLEAASEVAKILDVGKKELWNNLKNAHVFRSIMHGNRADDLLRSASMADSVSWKAKGKLSELTADFLRDRSEPGQIAQRAQREFRRANEFYERHDYMRAVLLLTESINRHAIVTFDLVNRLGIEDPTIDVVFRALEGEEINPLTANDLQKLRLLRNAIVHVDEPHKSAKELIESPTKLAAFLKGTLEKTREAFFN